MAIDSIYKYAVNSMCYLVLKMAYWEEHFEYYEELVQWAGYIEPDTDAEVIAYIADCIHTELQEGNYFDYGIDNFFENIQDFFGPQYDDFFFYHIIKAEAYRVTKEREK